MAMGKITANNNDDMSNADKKLQRRSSLSRLGNASFINVFSPPTASTIDSGAISVADEDRIRLTGQDPNTKLVYEIINSIFDKKFGYYECSSSSCSSLANRSSEYSFDKRLKYWKDSLAERRQIGYNIKSKTGKVAGELLFNRVSTIDERDKQTVKRLIDYADRMNPLALRNKKKSRLPEYWLTDECGERRINELEETLPKAEQDKGIIVEISGLSAIAKEEQLGKRKEQGYEKKYQWMRSKVLEQRIEDKREDIERVIEFYPDIEHLEIVGESLQRPNLLQHNSEIELLKEETIRRFSSSDSSECEAANNKPQESIVEEQPPIEYGIKLNDQIFILSSKRSSKNVNVEINFISEPFENVVKRVLRIENIGKKVLNFEWAQRSYYAKTGNLLKSQDEDFLFHRRPFRLISGEARDVLVQYQPRKINTCKEKWVLKIDPQFFCRKMDGVIVKLCGYCKPPPEYTNKLDEMQRLVIDKSNLKMMRKLTTHVGDITPMITPPEVICPYKRELNELELFEQYNPGYTCERFHDIEMLKDVYQRAKKPRDRAWDLTLESLKATILRLDNAERRALIFGEMVGILESMRGTPAELATKGTENPERDRTRLLYVRGIISSGIDEWEEMAYNLEENFIKPAIKEYYEELMAAEEEEEEASASEELLLVDDEAVREKVIKKVRRRKVFRDTLYMQTYTYLCNFVEDIVSVIESTEIV